MAYETSSTRDPVDASVLELAKAEQEDRDFVEAFNRAAARRHRSATTS